ncbi:putative Nicastrin [Trypanosoma cruzi]|nr:putative Nicastrin [Trypanosoma cruzi]
MLRRRTVCMSGCPRGPTEWTSIFVLWIAAWLMTCGATAERGFSGDVPPAPHDAAYAAYFRNYAIMRPCIMKAVFMAVKSDDQSNNSVAYRGCSIADNAVVPHGLLLLHATEVAQASMDGCEDNAPSLQEIIRGLSIPDTVATSGIGLVLSTRDKDDYEEGGRKNRVKTNTQYDMTCFLAAVQHYNAVANKHTQGLMPPITAVAFSDDNRCCRFSGDRRSGEELLLPREVRSVYDFVILYFPSAATSSSGPANSDWTALMNAAEFNRIHWAEGRRYPQNVLETRNGMPLAELLSSPTRVRSCLEGPSPSCVPLSGWTVWTSTADMRWEWNETSLDFEKKTRKGAVALLVASTAVSLVQDATPGADCPASAIVATLSVLEALRRAGGEDSRDVYAFFFPGEHVGSIGSARFISDATMLECVHAGLSNCTALAYKENLNFTTVDFNAIDTFLVVDQVAYQDAPLYYHVDSRVETTGSAQQQKAELEMEKSGVRRASTTRLPYSPITTLLDLLPAVMAGEKVFLTLTRYNTTFANPDVFTVVDKTAEHSALRPASVAEAADVMLRVLLPPTQNAAETPPVTSVNRSLVEQLWGCFTENLQCKFLSASNDVAEFMAPDYSVGDMANSRITDTQAAIEAALHRIGWTDVARSPAVPKSLRVPHGDWGATWEQDKDWMRLHNDSRYELHVMSFWRGNIGARSTMVGSETVSLIFLILSITATISLTLCIHVCVRK